MSFLKGNLIKILKLSHKDESLSYEEFSVIFGNKNIKITNQSIINVSLYKIIDVSIIKLFCNNKIVL